MPKSCTLAWAYNMCLQVLNRLEDLHRNGYIHGDIKLQNIVEGDKEPDKFYLIDFGLASCYVDECGQHRPKVKTNRF